MVEQGITKHYNTFCLLDKAKYFVEENIEKALSLKGKLVIDRTKYDIKFRSGNFFKDLGDTLIYNDFELDFNITAEATFTGQSNN
mgnify:CR=1 FL=1